MPSTRQSITVLPPRSPPTTQMIATPPTPSTAYHNSFDSPLNLGTTHTFHDSGYFDHNGEKTASGTGYEDFTLYDEDEDMNLEYAYDTDRFFADADATTQPSSFDKYSPAAAYQYLESTTSSTTTPQSYNSAPPISPNPNSDLFTNVRRSLENNHIHTPPTTPDSDNISYAADGEAHKYSPILQDWHSFEHRHEKIACNALGQFPCDHRESSENALPRSSK